MFVQFFDTDNSGNVKKTPAVEHSGLTIVEQVLEQTRDMSMRGKNKQSRSMAVFYDWGGWFDNQSVHL